MNKSKVPGPKPHDAQYRMLTCGRVDCASIAFEAVPVVAILVNALETKDQKFQKGILYRCAQCRYPIDPAQRCADMSALKSDPEKPPEPKRRLWTGG